MTNDILNTNLSSNNYAPANYRSADVFGGHYPIPTPTGVIHTTQSSSQAPPLPPRPNSFYQQSHQMYSPYNNNSMGYGSPMMGGSGYYGMGYNNNMFGGYGNFRQGFNSNPMDPESRFIQMAEESSRSAFQSIESVVMTIGNIATMLDSTYFALTSAFRAILGLAANFSHLRGFFARFTSTFTIFKSFIWIYKKMLFMLGISKTNPSSQINLNEAFKDAEKVNTNDFFNSAANSGSSGLPMVLFLAFVFSAPYLIMKLLGSLMNSTNDQTKNPANWVNAVEAIALYNFNGSDPSELSLIAGQQITIAPKEIQQMNRLLSTNWLMAFDGKKVGLIPVNYIKRIEPSKIINEPCDITMESVLVKDGEATERPKENTNQSC